MAYSEAQNKATQRYQREHCEVVSFRVRKGERDKLRAAATAAGYPSIPAYIVALVNADRGEQVLTPAHTRRGAADADGE